jgi:hypothetical protein
MIALGGSSLPCSGCVPEGPGTGPEPGSDVRLPARDGAAAEAPAPAPPSQAAVFRDDFERSDLGPAYRAVGDQWQLASGRLCVEGAKNQGVWLSTELPERVRIEFDAEAQSAEGDIKVELFGDGESGASSATYDDATGYVAIFGGWQNTRHVLARLDEHGDDRLVIDVDTKSEEPVRRPVSPGQVYHFRFERRDGKTLEWSIDGVTYLVFVDDRPLAGAGHEHFGFNNWSAPVCFDNLTITPLSSP